MYTAFNVKLDLSFFSDIKEYIEIGKNQKNILESTVNKDIKNYVLANEIIDGEKIIGNWFKTIKSDVFLSHSHNDTDLVFAFAGFLKKELDLNVFIDELVWSSADDLLKIIDNEYAYQPSSKTYNYKLRNLTTSHVHSMLSTAIQSIMDNSESIFFLNTDESFPCIGDIVRDDNPYTLSPWIFQEVQNAKLLKITDWSEYRKETLLEHSAFASKKLNIAYKTPINEFAQLTSDDIQKWHKKYINRVNEPYNGIFIDYPDHALNYLYETVFERYKI